MLRSIIRHRKIFPPLVKYWFSFVWIGCMLVVLYCICYLCLITNTVGISISLFNIEFAQHTGENQMTTIIIMNNRNKQNEKSLEYCACSHWLLHVLLCTQQNWQCAKWIGKRCDNVHGKLSAMRMWKIPSIAIINESHLGIYQLFHSTVIECNKCRPTNNVTFHPQLTPIFCWRFSSTFLSLVTVSQLLFLYEKRKTN